MLINLLSEVETINIDMASISWESCSKWEKFKTLNEYQLEDKSGASTRGNSSSNSVYESCCS